MHTFYYYIYLVISGEQMSRKQGKYLKISRKLCFPEIINLHLVYVYAELNEISLRVFLKSCPNYVINLEKQSFISSNW